MRADVGGNSGPLLRSVAEQELRQHNQELAVVNALLLKTGQSFDLGLVLEGALDVLLDRMGFEAGCVFLADAGGQHLAMAACRGASFRGTPQLPPLVKDDASGSSWPGNVQVVEDVRAYSDGAGWPGFAGHSLASLASVPLRSKGNLIGVLLFGSEHPRRFHPREVNLLSVLGAQLSTAIEHCRLYQEQRQAVESLQAANRLLSLKQAIFDRLIGLVLERRGMESIADALAELLGNPVCIVNQYFRLLYHSQGAQMGLADGAWEATPPDPQKAVREPLCREHLSTVVDRRRPVLLPALPEHGFDCAQIVAPILMGGEVLGYLSILEGERPLHPEDLAAAQQASIVVALEMMKEKVAAEVEHRLQGELLQDLLTSRYHSDSAMLSRASYLGLNLALPHWLLVVDIDQFSYTVDSLGSAEDQVVRLKRRLFEAVKAAVSRSYPSSLAVSRSDSVVVLVERGRSPRQRSASADKDAMALAQAIKSEVERFLPSLSVSICVSPTCCELEDYRLAYERARRSLAALKSLQRRGAVISSEQLGVYNLLFDHSNQGELLRFAEGVLGPLLTYDREHGTDLVRTLERYLRQDCRLEPTAAELSIHRSTLLYRLQRIEEIGKLDLRDPDVRFNAQLALRIWRVAELPDQAQAT